MKAPVSRGRRAIGVFVGKHVINPIVRSLIDRGVAMPGMAILETTGRKTGLPRRIPVTNGLDGTIFWLVSEHGRHSAYVRNLEHQPRVRVKVAGSWLAGTAAVLEGDDPDARLAHIRKIRPASQLSSRMVKVLGTQRLTIRISLDATQSG